MRPILAAALLAGAPCAAHAAVILEQNPAGVFLDHLTIDGISTTISNVAPRTIDAQFLQTLESAMFAGVNGFSNYFFPVSAPIDFTVTLDRMVAGVDPDPDYPGGGFRFEARYTAESPLDDWRLIRLNSRRYAPDAQFGFANFSYTALDSESLDEADLLANLPFYRTEEQRDGSTDFGSYDIAHQAWETWFTIRGSFLEMEDIYILARVNDADELEVGGAWGFNTLVVVPAPSSALALLALGAVSRRRR